MSRNESRLRLVDSEKQDLAISNVPGRSARERAHVERQLAPMRSLVGRLFLLDTAEQRWKRGAQGEEKVAERLASLPANRWSVYHDLPVGKNRANIDHLVIGPPGIFTLNTKHLRGDVWVAEHAVRHNNQPTDFLRNARHEAKRAAKLLSAAVGRPVVVHPLLVIYGPNVKVTVKAQPEDVTVLTSRELVKWLQARPELFASRELRDVEDAAWLRSTWQPPRKRRVDKTASPAPSPWQTSPVHGPPPLLGVVRSDLAARSAAAPPPPAPLPIASPPPPPPATPTEATDAQRQTGSPLVVKPWSRGGRRRIYVNDLAGKTLGWYDREAETFHIEDKARTEEITAAVTSYLRAAKGR